MDRRVGVSWSDLQKNKEKYWQGKVADANNFMAQDLKVNFVSMGNNRDVSCNSCDTGSQGVHIWAEEL